MERFSRIIQHYNSFISVFFQNDIVEMLLKITSDSFYNNFSVFMCKTESTVTGIENSVV